MKLGYRVNTPDVPDVAGLRGLRGDLAECFALVADLGYTGVELAVADPDAARDAAREWLRVADRHGLEVVALSTDLLATLGSHSLMADDPVVFESAQSAYRAAIDLAAELECPLDLGLVAGSVPEDQPGDVVQSRAVSVVFTTQAARAADMGATILLKPVRRPLSNLICDLETARSAAVRTNWPTFRLAVDTGLLDLREDGLWDQLRRAAPLIQHVVLAGADGGSLCPEPGEVARLLTELAAHGYDGWHVVATCDEHPAEAAHQAHAYLSKVLA